MAKKSKKVEEPKETLKTAIAQLMQEKGYSEDSIRQTIEKALKAAYKRTYGTDENAIVKFNDDMSDVSIYSRKVVVDGVYDPVNEIELEDAKLLSEDIEEGDEIDILEDPTTFDRSAVATGKQQVHVGLNETYKNSLMNEYKDKVGEIIIGYYQLEKKGNIYVDLGNTGKVEGVLPARFQSKLEYYEKNDRIKALITDIKSTSNGIQLILSRSDPKLVSSILEKEVPEIADGTVEIIKIVRDAGYRTKIAVYSKREDVDPVGACVGLKGVRIQNVIRELMNEKIDVLKWDPNPVEFIKNALSPAKVSKVLITDNDKKTALAIVEESQFSLAIGKQGQNVRLANKLCDWNIDVKTVESASELDLSSFTTVQNAHALFSDEENYENESADLSESVTTENENVAVASENKDYEEAAAYDDFTEITTISELPDVNMEIANVLKEAGIDLIEDFVEAYDNGTLMETLKDYNVSQESLDEVNELINNNVEFVDEEVAEEEGSETTYQCPVCGATVTPEMTQCPNCNATFEN